MPDAIVQRLDRVRERTRSAGVEALVVTHLPNIRYLTGFEATAGAAIVLPSRCLLIADFRYITAARELTAPLPSGLVDVEIVDRSYDETIAAALARERPLRVGIEAAYLPVARFSAISARLSAAASSAQLDPPPVLVATERVVERARMIKDADEIATLREAARRLSAIARTLPELAIAGRSEQQVAELIDEALKRSGFSRPAFDTIVASGPNSALPHARPGERVLRAGDPVVLDFGGVYDGYCVDLTRTVQLGAVSMDVSRLFEAVAEAQAAAIAAVRPGRTASAVDRAARAVLEQHGLGEAFGHGTGHGLGLEVHEEPRISRVAAGQPDDVLEPGMVFTVEPGAYVAGLGGVRIEDDVLVTAEGCEVLTE